MKREVQSTDKNLADINLTIMKWGGERGYELIQEIVEFRFFDTFFGFSMVKFTFFVTKTFENICAVNIKKTKLNNFEV